MSHEVRAGTRRPVDNASWVLRLPSQIALLLTTFLIVLSQWNPCDTVLGIAKGDSIPLMAMSMAVGFFVVMDWALDRQPSRTPVVVCLVVGSSIAFACWLRLATHFQITYTNGRYSLNGCWQWISQMVVLLSLMRLTRTNKVANAIMSLFLCCAIGTVAITLLQYFYTLPRDRSAFAQDPNHFLSQVGIVPGSSDAMLYSNRLNSLEPTGPFALTNSLAGFMLVWLVFLVALIALVWTRRVSTANIRWSLISLFGFFAILACALWLTRSRSAILALGIGSISVLLSVPQVQEKIVTFVKSFRMATVGVLGGLIAIFAFIANREPQLFTGASQSLAYRLEYWQGAWKILLTHPWFGVGSCNFQSSYARVKVMTASETPADPHHFLVEVACAGGFPLVLLVIAMLAAISFPIFRELAWRRAACPLERSEQEAAHGILEAKLVSFGASLACFGLLAFYYMANNDEMLVAALLFLGCGSLAWLVLRFCKIPLCFSESKSVCLVSAGSLLLHLCFAGGWMTPGVMSSFSMLVAMGLRPNRSDESNPVAITPGIAALLVPRMSLLVFPILLLAAALDFANTVCLPTMNSANELSVEPQRLSSRSDQDWLDTMQLDRWDPELCRRVSEQCVQVLTQRNLSNMEQAKWSAAFDEASREFLRRDPNHWSASTECGRWHMMLCEKLLSQSKDPNEKPDPSGKTAKQMNSSLEHRSLALANFNQAALEFPNSVPCQLQAAVAAAWVGDWQNMSEKLEAAQAIDRTTSHLDRKMEAALVFFPYSLEAQGVKLPSSAWQDSEPMMARGEPVLDWLRNFQNDRGRK